MRPRLLSGALLALPAPVALVTLVTLVTLGTMTAGMAVTVATSAAPSPATAEPSAFPNDDQTIVHVLNRTGFGPGPGDVEAVRALGLQNYIERQLQPERIPDPKMDARLADLATLRMSSRQIAEEFAMPLLAARRDRKQAAANDADAAPKAPNPAQQQANRVMVELTDAKVLRAAYSERQLQEVLV